MRSMTGHGRGVAEIAGRRVTVEIRSVNHRFFDLKLRAQSLDPRVEDRVTGAIRKRAERGSFTVTIRDESAAGSQMVRVDAALARSTWAALDELRRSLGLEEQVPLSLVAAQPGVITVGEPTSDDPDVVFASISPALETALAEMVDMRRREGESLARDLGARLDRIESVAAEVGKLAATGPEEQRRRLMERLSRLLSGSNVPVDEARLASEVALFADRVDVTEEIVRLASHLKQMRALLAEDTAVGRRLDFLTQELGREVNTIGSKSQSADIAARVVSAKAEVEKIREQVQNVE